MHHGISPPVKTLIPPPPPPVIPKFTFPGLRHFLGRSTFPNTCSPFVLLAALNFPLFPLGLPPLEVSSFAFGVAPPQIDFDVIFLFFSLFLFFFFLDLQTPRHPVIPARGRGKPRRILPPFFPPLEYPGGEV